MHWALWDPFKRYYCVSQRTDNTKNKQNCSSKKEANTQRYYYRHYSSVNASDLCHEKQHVWKLCKHYSCTIKQKPKTNETVQVKREQTLNGIITGIL